MAAGSCLGKLSVGTAGFANSHWTGRFYAPHAKKSEDQLECYQETFNIVEVNSTFYGVPSEETIAAWKRRAAHGFQFSLKVPRAVTHDGGLASDSALESLRHFLLRVKGLGAHLAVLLFQCSRGLRVDVGKLQRVFEELGRCDMQCRVALELRDVPSSQDPVVIGWLRERNWALVQHPNTLGRATAASEQHKVAECYPLEPLRDLTTANFVYVRLHGNNDTHSYCYSESELSSYSEQLHNWRTKGLEVFAFLLNDSAEAAMPHNAKQLLEMVHRLSGEPVPRGPKLAHQRSLTSFFKPSQPAAKRPRHS